MTAGTRDAARIPSVRWVGTWAIVASGLAVAGSVAEIIGLRGLDLLPYAVWDVLPWVVILILALLVRLLPSAQSLGSALGVAVVGALVAGPQLLSALTRWARVVGSDQDVFDLPIAVHGGLFLQVAASLMLVVAIVVPVARIALLDAREVPRSPFRVEVLALIAVLVLTALTTSGTVTDGWTSAAYSWVAAPDWVSSLGGLAPLLSWLVPLALVLALALRSSGVVSLWVAGALLVGVVVEPLLRWVITLGVGQSSDLPSGFASFAAPDGPVLSRGLAIAPSSLTMVIPAVLIALVVLLWNTRTSTVVPSSGQSAVDGGAPPSAPIDPWAGVAFLLSFLSLVPLVAIPAIILGHASYEGIVARGETQRGRLLAAAAIVIAIISFALVVLLPVGGLASVDDVLGSDVVPW